ncbi:hypothetical protein BW13_02385 [Bifidobacterium sp. UTCIF-37]|uniref:hypothetical protein n=1 Tax=unclassified Bifidobacterium TaxID=2608897 RepID=UPI00112E7AF7|nr:MULTISPECIES: hypothetical protein [unclassified Bifidobacterium]TPF87111.1 hypothetical protein BW13_02385 [Bifidobacterium sp. UTCIF-37]TPF90489.1 hypothetical protein BW11_02720 [Bifidobacterium sp. UTCIF-38]
MGYEQLSTVIVLIIVLIGVVVWLPIRTSNSMRHVEEHRDDRYSTSLHLVDEHSGTRFSDDTTFAKGVQMQPSERRASKLTPERIAEVRRLRHAAVRRRQMIVAALLVITVVVLVLAVTLHFSTLFALIPAALTAVVLALGAHAASQARAWERKVAEAKARERKSKAARAKARKAAQAQAAQVGSSPRGESAGDAAPTDEMTSLEIRRALRQAQIEQKRALAERARKIAEAQARVEAEQARLAAAQAEAEARAAAQAQAVAQAQAAQVAQAAQDQQTSAAPAASPESSAPQTQSASNVGAPVMVAPQQAVSGATGSPVVSKNTSKTKDAAASQSDASDHTTELAEVHPARALDAYDMATSQDLISFSLGEARNVEAESVAPESREIKSMRQVAKAEPVDAERERELAEEAKVETAPARQADAHVEHEGQQPAEATQSAEPVAETNGVGANESDAGMSDVEAFHESEEQAKVAVPAATSDSLGNNLAAILARRGA